MFIKLVTIIWYNLGFECFFFYCSGIHNAIFSYYYYSICINRYTKKNNKSQPCINHRWKALQSPPFLSHCILTFYSLCYISLFRHPYQMSFLSPQFFILHKVSCCSMSHTKHTTLHMYLHACKFPPFDTPTYFKIS